MRLHDAVANVTDDTAHAAVWMQGNAAIRERWHTVSHGAADGLLPPFFGGRILLNTVIAAWCRPAFCTVQRTQL